jgi:DNA adenine methylase
VNGFLPWLGGKRRLANLIAGHLERLPHACYVEPFAGAGHVFFRKSPAAGDVLADRNAELMVLYRVLQRHVEEFLRCFRWALVSRAEFERQKTARPDTLTDVQRAVRFYYLQKLAFGGRAVEQSFGVDTLHRPRINLLRLEETLSAVHLRLAGVGLECLDWRACLARHDGPDTLFYLDPPYWGSEGDYGAGLFAREDFAALREALAALRGRFVLSLNDRPEVRALFGDFHLLPVQTLYTIHARINTSQAAELLISNAALAG